MKEHGNPASLEYTIAVAELEKLEQPAERSKRQEAVRAETVRERGICNRPRFLTHVPLAV